MSQLISHEARQGSLVGSFLRVVAVGDRTRCQAFPRTLPCTLIGIPPSHYPRLPHECVAGVY
jgi:hypothetical protein